MARDPNIPKTLVLTNDKTTTIKYADVNGITNKINKLTHIFPLNSNQLITSGLVINSSFFTSNPNTKPIIKAINEPREIM